MTILRGYDIREGGPKPARPAKHNEFFLVVNKAKALISDPHIDRIELRDPEGSALSYSRNTVVLYSDDFGDRKIYDFKAAKNLVFRRAKNSPVSADIMMLGRVSEFEILVCNEPLRQAVEKITNEEDKTTGQEGRNVLVRNISPSRIHFAEEITDKDGKITGNAGQRVLVRYESKSDSPLLRKITRIEWPPKNPVTFDHIDHDSAEGDRFIVRCTYPADAECNMKVLTGEEAATKIAAAYRALRLKRPPALHT